MTNEETFTATESGVIIDNPGVKFHLLQMRAALSIEIGTGMKFSGGSVLAHAKRCGYTNKNTKRGAYADIDALIVAHGGNSRPLTD